MERLHKKWIIGALVAVTVVAAAFIFIGKSSAVLESVDLRGEREVSVVLRNDGFEPQLIRIDRGTRVVFTTTRNNQFWPASNAHPSHGIYPQFDPKTPLEPTESWSFIFDEPGTWEYHDHVRSYFTGTVYVSE